MKNDNTYMKKALQLAQQAFDVGEIPIGAVVVSPYGDELGHGFNISERSKCQIDHAEMVAVRSACQKIDDWRLDGCTIYVTLEPCLMCFGALALSRIERIVYGAQSPLFGYHLDNDSRAGLYTRQIKNITPGVLAEESAALLKSFFALKREKKREFHTSNKTEVIRKKS